MKQVVVASLIFVSSAIYAEVSLCTKTERMLFNCQIARSAKIVSICGSKDLTRDRGYLQYRFGTPKKIEFVFPTSKVGTQQQFYWSRSQPYQSYVYELTFANGGYFYTISSYEYSEEHSGTPGGFRGGNVVVQKKGEQKYQTLNCTGDPSGEFYLEGVVRNEDELVGTK